MDRENSKISTSTAVWIATAILHNENPKRDGFQGKEIYNKIKELKIINVSDSTLRTHISHHCVATADPTPNKDRKLIRLDNGLYRLFKDGIDEAEPARAGGEIMPKMSKLPPQFRYLVRWYLDEYIRTPISLDGIDVLSGEIFYSNIQKENTIKIPEKVIKHLNAKQNDLLVFFRADNEGILIKKGNH